MSEQYDIDDLSATKPIQSITEGEPDDLFITCVSFEPRTEAVVNSLSEDYESRKGIIYVNEELLSGSESEQINRYLSSVEDQLMNYCGDVEIARGSWLNVADQLAALKEKLAGCEDIQRVSVDSTTFNREALLIALNLIYTNNSPDFTRVFYTSPRSHGDWLSKGHLDTRNILGFSGLQKSTRPTLLVVLSGFETNRTMRIIEEYEPSKVLLGIGDPPTDDSFLDRNQQEQDLVLGRQETEEFRFPTDDIQACSELLIQTLEEYTEEWNIVIAPMSTKLSTISAWLAARHHMEAQLTYSLPAEYNIRNYSEGAKTLFVDCIPD